MKSQSWICLLAIAPLLIISQVASNVVFSDEETSEPASESNSQSTDDTNLTNDNVGGTMRHRYEPILPGDYVGPFGDPFVFPPDSNAETSDSSNAVRRPNSTRQNGASQNGNNSDTDSGSYGANTGVISLRKPEWPPSDDTVNSVVRTYDGVAKAAVDFRRRSSDLVDSVESYNSTIDRASEQVSKLEAELADATARRKSETDIERADIERRYDKSRYNLCPNGHTYDECDHTEGKQLWELLKQNELSKIDQMSSSADGDIRKLKKEMQSWKDKSSQYSKQQQKFRQQTESGKAWSKKFNAGDALWSIFNK